MFTMLILYANAHVKILSILPAPRAPHLFASEGLLYQLQTVIWQREPPHHLFLALESSEGRLTMVSTNLPIYYLKCLHKHIQAYYLTAREKVHELAVATILFQRAEKN